MLDNNKQELVLRHITFADKIAVNYFSKTPPQVQLDELKSAAYTGLVDAANRYDGQRNFESFAAWRIIGEIKDYLRSLRWSKHYSVSSIEGMDFPVEDQENLEISEECLRGISPFAKNILKMYYGREMTLTEIAAKIKMTPARISQLIKENIGILRNCLHVA